jgi:hypothetical protein
MLNLLAANFGAGGFDILEDIAGTEARSMCRPEDAVAKKPSKPRLEQSQSCSFRTIGDVANEVRQLTGPERKPLNVVSCPYPSTFAEQLYCCRICLPSLEDLLHLQVIRPYSLRRMPVQNFQFSSASLPGLLTEGKYSSIHDLALHMHTGEPALYVGGPLTEGDCVLQLNGMNQMLSGSPLKSKPKVVKKVAVPEKPILQERRRDGDQIRCADGLPPMDWSLKTSARFVSPTSFDW